MTFRLMIPFCLYLLLIAPLGAQLPMDHDPALLTQAELTQLEKGKILLAIEERAADDIVVKAWLVMNQPVDRTWELLANSREQRKYQKSISEIYFFPIDATHQRIEYVIRWFIFKKRFSLLHAHFPETYIMQWALDPAYPNELRSHTGYWQLYAYPGNRTLAIFADNMSIKGFPVWFENLIKKEIIRSSMKDIKNYVDKRVIN